ncbi:hypothetical protein K1719_013127 [Acacia pycnantha]|nr:hypothetical protein K1719_013127 [Acacia pycnantha]
MYSDQKTENGHNHNKSPLQIKQDDKFFNRLLSKENGHDPSFRVTPVAVPFLWESHPGTPKHPLFSGDLSFPPLTPPPSHFYNNNSTKKKISRSNLFHFSFPRFNLKKTPLVTSSFSSSLSSSSSSSDSSSTVGRRKWFSSCDSSADLWGHSNFEEYDDNSAAVVVGDSRRIPSCCFGFRRSSSANGGIDYRRHEA